MMKSKRQLKLLEEKDAAKEPFGLKSSLDKLIFAIDQLSKWLGKTPGQTVKLLSFLVGALCLIVTVFSIFQIPNLRTSYSINQFFPSGHSLFIEAEEIRKTFYLEDNAGFLIVLNLPHDQGKTWLTPSQIHTLEKITEYLEKDSLIKSVTSLSNVDGVFESDENLTIGSIFENLPSSDWENYIRNQPVIAKQLITPDFRSTLVIAEPKDVTPQALEQLTNQFALELKKITPESNIQIGGVPAIQGQFAKKLRSELILYLSLSCLIFCLVFYILIRGKSALFFVFANIILGNLIALGALAYFDISFSVLLTTLPIILSLVIVSLSVHTLDLWAEKLNWLSQSKKELNLFDKFKTSLSVLQELALPNFLGSLTTAIGFMSLMTSSVPLIREYGIIVGCAVMGGWIFIQLSLGAFMIYTSPRLTREKARSSMWSLKPLQWSRSTFAAILLVSIGMGVMGTQVHFSSRLFDDLPKNDQARAVTEEVDEQFGGVLSYDLILKSEDDGFFKTSQNAIKLENILKEIKSLSGVGSALTYTDLAGKKATSSNEKLAETFFLFSLTSPNPLSNYVTDDGKKLRLAIRFKDLPGDQIKALRSKITSQVASLFPTVKVVEGGLSVRAHTINEEVSRALIFGFIESLIFIGAFLVFIFRSFRWALIACIPNLIPPAFLLGTMAYFETPIKPTLALIFSIALGFAFNNTVYLLGRLKKICGSRTPSPQDLSRALLQEAYPCLSETLLMFFGFMIFLSSTFQVNQMFGVYMLLSIFAGFLGDLIFLPVMIKNFPNLLGKQKEEPKEEENKQEPRSFPPESQIAASLALILTAALLAPPSQAAPSREVKQLLVKVQKKVEARDDQANVKMVITEPNGQKKEREMELSTLRDDRFYARVRILSPADVKNTGFLAQVTPEEEQHWIYIPSTKKVRRVVGSNKNAGILGSELTIEDLDPSALRASKVSIKSKDSKKIILEVLPEKGTSPYTRVLTAVSATEFVPIRTLYYKGNKKVKSVDFLKYKKVGGGIWRAQQIKVKNFENKRGTDLFLTEMKSNTGLEKSEFSQNSLKFN